MGNKGTRFIFFSYCSRSETFFGRVILAGILKFTEERRSPIHKILNRNSVSCRIKLVRLGGMLLCGRWRLVLLPPLFLSSSVPGQCAQWPSVGLTDGRRRLRLAEVAITPGKPTLHD